jgi:hypothetical protein
MLRLPVWLEPFLYPKHLNTQTFAPATTLALNQSPYTLSATASSNLPVNFTSSPASICTVSGTALTLVAAGNCVVIAQQAGNSTYAAATNAVRTISLSKASQSITFAPATTLALNQSPYTLSATASDLPFSFTSSPASICTVFWNCSNTCGSR